MGPDRNILSRIPPAARRELLRVLTSDSRVRADVIKQFHERGLDLVDVLIDLEADADLRAEVVTALRRAL